MSFNSQQNRAMVWGLLSENYGTENLTYFQNEFENIIQNIHTNSNNYSNLTEMNKDLLSRSSKHLMDAAQKTRRDKLGIERMGAAINTRAVSTLNSSFKEREQSFKHMMERDKPNEINFADTKSHEFNGKLNDLMSQQLSERASDMANITQGYNTKDAQQWINQKAPPLTIDHDKPAQVKIDVLTPKKRVTFQESTPEYNSFLTKMKKTTRASIDSRSPHKNHNAIISRSTKILSPDKIENNTYYFNSVMRNVNEFSILKVFFHNAALSHTNKLGQHIVKKLEDEIFLLCKITMNEKVNQGEILLLKKFQDDVDVVYSSDEQISVPRMITSVAMTFLNRNDEQLLISPLLPVQHFFKGGLLNIKSDKQKSFHDNQYCYIILKDDLLLIGEKILINNDKVIVLGSCKINVHEGNYHLEDIEKKENHNCAIIEWEVNHLGKIPSIYRAPTFHFAMIS